MKSPLPLLFSFDRPPVGGRSCRCDDRMPKTLLLALLLGGLLPAAAAASPRVAPLDRPIPHPDPDASSLPEVAILGGTPEDDPPAAGGFEAPPMRPFALAWTNPDVARATARAAAEAGLEPDELREESAGWTFSYRPLGEEAARRSAALRRLERGEAWDVQVEYDGRLRSWVVREEIRCPDGLPDRVGLRAWGRCFENRSEAEDVALAVSSRGLPAEVESLEDGRWALWYLPLGQAAASFAAEVRVQDLPGGLDGLYTAELSFDAELDSWTFETELACPAGWVDLGRFRATSYVLAREIDYPESRTVRQPCGLEGSYRRDFLFSRRGAPGGVMMQGSGVTEDGRVVSYREVDGRHCFAEVDCPRTAAGTCAEAGRTVAVDPAVVPLGAELLIEGVGRRTAEDTGGGVRGRHVDVYRGIEMTPGEAMGTTLHGVRVCAKLD